MINPMRRDNGECAENGSMHTNGIAVFEAQKQRFSNTNSQRRSFVNGSGKALSHDRDTKMDVSWWTRSTLERHGKHWASSQGIIRGPHLKMGTKTHRMATRPKSQ